MDSFTSTLLPLRFVTPLEFGEPSITCESDTLRRSLVELPDWAPPQRQPAVDSFSPFETSEICDDHYESWQGISW